MKHFCRGRHCPSDFLIDQIFVEPKNDDFFKTISDHFGSRKIFRKNHAPETPTSPTNLHRQSSPRSSAPGLTMDSYGGADDSVFLPGGLSSRLSTRNTPGAATPRTGTSRQRSSRTATGRRTRTANTRSDDAFVVALIENQAKEVGFCVYNINGFDVELRQFADSNSFATTIATICIFE